MSLGELAVTETQLEVHCCRSAGTIGRWVMSVKKTKGGRVGRDLLRHGRATGAR
jgi:hypothetical protein